MLQTAQYLMGGLIVVGMAVPGAAMIFSGSDGKKAVSPLGASQRARSQMSAVHKAFQAKPKLRGSREAYRRKMARKREIARRNYRKWSKSKFFKKKTIRLRYKTIRVRRR